MGSIRDHCGVIGIAAREPVAPFLYYGIHALQHRGQESAGMTTVDAQGQGRTEKGMGLVDQVFTPDKVAAMKGSTGIAHCRYSTAGRSVADNAQPHTVITNVLVSLAHNGDIVNAAALQEDLKSKGVSFVTDNDTEVVARLLASKVVQHPDNPIKAIKEVMAMLVGAYSFGILIGPDLYAVRDPYAIRPFVVGKLPGNGGHVVASESVALDVLGAEFIRDLAAGEIVRITPDVIESHRTTVPEHPAHCFFEYVYFARGDSVIDGHLAQEARHRIGAALARQAPVKADIVVPVPDSGRAHAAGYAAASGIPLREGLMKNRYVHRTFIMPGQDTRERNVRLKLNPIKQILVGQRVVIVDDSIVRSTTMRRIVQLVREAGAKEVHVRIASPPITDPCYLGVDFHHRSQLVAHDHTPEKIREMIGADSLAYTPIDSMVTAIGLPKTDMCLGCVTGEYPVPITGERVRGQVLLDQFNGAAKGAPKPVVPTSR